jgi:hypothetical protein
MLEQVSEQVVEMERFDALVRRCEELQRARRFLLPQVIPRKVCCVVVWSWEMMQL